MMAVKEVEAIMVAMVVEVEGQVQLEIKFSRYCRALYKSTNGHYFMQFCNNSYVT